MVSRWLLNPQLSSLHLKAGIVDGQVRESGHGENSHTPFIFYKKRCLPQKQVCRFPLVSYWPDKGHVITWIKDQSEIPRDKAVFH